MMSHLRSLDNEIESVVVSGGQTWAGGAVRDHGHEQQHHRGAPPGSQGVHRMSLQGAAGSFGTCFELLIDY